MINIMILRLNYNQAFKYPKADTRIRGFPWSMPEAPHWNSASSFQQSICILELPSWSLALPGIFSSTRHLQILTARLKIGAPGKSSLPP
jgi:hypothetical protein